MKHVIELSDSKIKCNTWWFHVTTVGQVQFYYGKGNKRDNN